MIRNNSLLAVLLLNLTVVYARINITTRPQSLYDVDDTLRVAWTGTANPCTLRYGERIGTYDNMISRTGADSLWFVPQDEGMGAGVHRWIISDGTDSSLVYDLFIQTDQSGMPGNANINPAAGETLSSVAELMPTFRWQARTAAIPYYHLVLLDEQIYLDHNWNLQNVSVIWQAIIPGTELPYMTPDPSGFFDNVTPPPLLNGKTYYWMVFNNLNGTPAFTSAMLANPFTFTVDAPQLDSGLTPLQLVAPEDSLLDFGLMGFSWEPLAGADGPVTYTVYVYAPKDFLTGEQCMYLRWQSAATTHTGTALDSTALPQEGWHKWMVVAETGGQRIASVPRHFYLNPPTRHLQITVTDTFGQPLPRVAVAGPDSLALFTDDNGLAEAEYYSGRVRDSVTLRFKKDAYHDTLVTVRNLNLGTTALPVAVTMTPKSSVFYGTVLDDSYGVGLNGVTVTAIGDAADEYSVTDRYGGYKVYADSGSWNFFYQEDGYKDRMSLNNTIGTNECIQLPDIALEAAYGTVSLAVVNEQGIPLSSVAIYGYWLEGGDTTTWNIGYTDGIGMIIFTAQEGLWKIYAEKAGYLQNYTVCTIIADSIAFRTITLNALPGQILGSVYQNAEPVSGAVIMYTGIRNYVVDSVNTDLEGLYSINVPSGTYQLTVSLDGYTTMIDTVRLRPGETKTVNFVMEPVVGIWPAADDLSARKISAIWMYDIKGNVSWTVRRNGIYIEVDQAGGVRKRIILR